MGWNTTKGRIAELLSRWKFQDPLALIPLNNFTVANLAVPNRHFLQNLREPRVIV